MTQESASPAPYSAEQAAVVGYTDQDVRLVGDAIRSSSVGGGWIADSARAVLAALAGAGRLLPEDTRTEYGVRWRDGAVTVVERESANYHAAQGYQNVSVLRREVGPWVPVPEEKPQDRSGEVSGDRI